MLRSSRILTIASLSMILAAGCDRSPAPDTAERAALPPGVMFEFVGALAGDASGREVEGIGDVNGDGVPDIAVGAPGTRNLAGEARIYSGADGALLHHFRGGASGIVLGREIAPLGDLDGDRRDDFLIAAPQFDLLVGNKDLPDAGRVFIHSGASGRVLHRYDGRQPGEYVGKAASAAGDVDGDGIADFLFSAPGRNAFAGEVVLHSGASGRQLRAWAGPESGGRFGWSVSGDSDLDADGRPDLVVGAPWSSAGGKVNAGAVYAFSGSSDRLLYRLDGETAGDGFGNSVAMLGDVDGDGRGDFVVGAPLANPGRQQDAGSVYVYSGGRRELLYRFDAAEATSLLGFSVHAAGDVDGDGVGDVLAGGQWIDSGGLYNAGSAFVYSGAIGELLHRIDGNELGGELGFAVAAGGDLDGDGRSEVVVGAPTCRGLAGLVQVVNLAGAPQGSTRRAALHPARP